MLRDLIGKSLGIDPGYIENITERNDKYKRYYINKKGGGRRYILQPSKELKVIQSWMVKNIFTEFPISRYSYAYSKHDSILNNAQAHYGSRYILHSDIESFFPSIDEYKLRWFFNKNSTIINRLGLNPDDIDLILKICLYKGSYLVIGSPASPIISNIFMYDFDNELVQLLEGKGKYIYTRYADDITISSLNYIPCELIKDIQKLMEKYGFKINLKKTYFSSKKDCRRITGIVIDNNCEKMSIGNRRYKEFERAIYNYLIKKQGNREYLLGYLNFIKSINLSQYNQLRRIYVKYDKKAEIFR